MAHRVSSLLAMAGCVDPWWFTDAGRSRGEIIHDIAQAILLGQKLIVSPDYAGYTHGLAAGFQALGFVPLCVERRLFSRDGLFHGRPDTCGIIPRPVGKIPAGPALVDVKSGKRLASHALQLGFYEMLAEEDEELQHALPPEWQGYPWTRVGLYVESTGSYRVWPYTDITDRAVCASILTTIGWRQAHGLITSGSDAGDGSGSAESHNDPVPIPGANVPGGGGRTDCGF